MRKAQVYVVLILIAITLVGCSRWQAAGDVLGQRAEDAVINQIGALDVQRQEVVNAIAEAEAEIERLVAVEADNAVEAAYLEDDLVALNEKKSEAQQEMRKLADHIESGEPLVLDDGTTISVAELEQYASRRIQTYETLNQQIAAKEETLGLYKQAVQEAAGRRTAGQRVITEMKDQLALIDAQIASLRVYEEQPELLGSGGESRDVIAEAAELVADTQKLVDKELRTRRQMAEIEDVGDLDSQISDALDEGSETATDVLSTLRSISAEAGE